MALLSLRISQAAVSAFCTLALAMQGAHEWHLSHSQVVWLAVVLAAVAVAEPVVRGFQDRSRARQLELNRKVSEALRGALAQVVHLCGPDLSWEKVGLNAFLVRRARLTPWREVLRRVGRERLANSPPPSQIRWTKGKGIIGRCWETGQTEGDDLASLSEQFSAADAEAWDALPRDQRLNLSHEEMRRTLRHETVVATPIVDGRGRVRGVVSLDAPSSSYDAVWSHQVRGTLDATAQTIWNLTT